MMRKIGVAMLSAALAFGTAPAHACTGISLKATDGAAIRGRTLEFGYHCVRTCSSSPRVRR